MNAANIAVKRVDDPRPCHVLCNEVNELTEKLTFSGRKDMTLFRVKEDGSRICRNGKATEVAVFTRSVV